MKALICGLYLRPAFGQQMEITKNMKITLLSIGAIAALLMAGCSQEAKSDMAAAGDSASNAAAHTGAAVSADTRAAGEATKEAGQAVAAGAEKAGATVVAGAQEAGTAVKEAGDKAVDATKDAAAAASNATMTPKVKTALHSANGLDVTKIDVDTVGKTITLKGSVPDAKQKKQAEDATKAIAGSEYKVVNNLTVGG